MWEKSAQIIDLQCKTLKSLAEKDIVDSAANALYAFRLAQVRSNKIR